MADKGEESARIPFGLMAQQVAEAFMAEGLRPESLALFCYDEWPDQYETKILEAAPTYDNEGQELSPATTRKERVLVREAGNRYGIRYSEALALECAYLRWRQDRLAKSLGNLPLTN